LIAGLKLRQAGELYPPGPGYSHIHGPRWRIPSRPDRQWKQIVWSNERRRHP